MNIEPLSPLYVLYLSPHNSHADSLALTLAGPRLFDGEKLTIKQFHIEQSSVRLFDVRLFAAELFDVARFAATG